MCNCNPLSPNSVASGVYTTFLQITQKILITDTCHWLEPITVILGFLKIFTFSETITHFRTILFFQSPKFQFSSPILDRLCVSFNAHHFFMRKQFMCVDCYTGRLTFSSIDFLTRQESNQLNTGCQLSWNEEGQMCARSCSI